MQTRDRVGQQFGNYRLVRLIGSGGCAEVYLAEHVHTDKLKRAIKVLTGTNLQDEQRAQFLAEARTVANLQSLNSHIVQIHDFGIQTSQNSADDGVPYLVMEYAVEGTLRRLYPHNTQVPLERIIFYTNQVAEALQCAHDQNPPIVHRDIKPENMLLRSHDHLLLSDFGIAMTGNTNSLAISTKEKEILGTVAYMAPERLSKRTRRASDQYALAVVVYEWLCGSLPFDGTDKEILYKQLVTPPSPLYPQYPHITKEIENVVMRALAKEPADRYPKVHEFAHALERAIQKALLQNQPTWRPLLPQATVPTMPSPKSQLSIIPLPQQQAGPSVLPTIELSTTQKAISPLVSPTPQQVVPPQQVASPTAQPPQLQVTHSAVPSKILPARQEVHNLFALSPQFARDQRLALFRGSGIILNALSAITIGLLERNNYFLFGGLIFSLVIFLLCVYIVEEKLALFFGTMIALYWGFVGREVGNFLASSLYLNQLFPSLFMGIVFFAASLGLHIWYISRKIP